MAEFAAEALKALHLNEVVQYIPSPQLWASGLLALIALLCCFRGYKCRNLWFSFLCVLAGTFIGSWLHADRGVDINWSTAAALLAAVLFVFTYRLAVPVLMFVMGYGLLTLRFGLSGLYVWIPCILLSAGGLVAGRWVTTVITSVIGSLFILQCVLPFIAAISDMPELIAPVLSSLTSGGFWYYTCAAVFAVSGFLTQADLRGNDPLFRIYKA